MNVGKLKYLKSSQNVFFFKGEKRLVGLTIVLPSETPFYDKK